MFRKKREVLTRRLRDVKLRIMDTNSYCRLNSRYDHLRFRCARFVVGLQRLVSSVGSRITALRILLLRSSGSVLPGMILAILLLLASKSQRLREAGSISSVLRDIPPESVGAYDSLLAVVLTISGLFLTLYYTNFNTVIGTLYAEFPESVRKLLIDEPQKPHCIVGTYKLILFSRW